MSHYKPYPAYKDSGVDWIGQVPEHWEVCPIKGLATGAGTLFIDGDWIESKNLSTEGIRYITTGNVGEGSYKEQGSGFISEATFHDLRCTEVLPGDVLISRLNPPIGRACIVPDLNSRIVTSVDNVILRPSAGFDQRFIVNRFSAADYFHELSILGSGATMQRVARSDLGHIRVVWPPPAEQSAISDAIDRETTRIDALIAKKTRFIELLKEKRQALITHAVTKGLDSGVKLQDSGVEWIGEVPEHWITVQLGKLAIARCDGPFGSGLKSEHYQPDGVRVIRLQNIGWASFKNQDSAFIAHDHWLEVLGGGHDVQPGDLLVAGLGDENNPLGRSCVAPDDLGDALVKADCYRFRINENKALPAFLALSLSATARAECGFMATGATRDRLNLGLASSRVVALPPGDEQASIVESVDQATTRIDALIGKTERSIDLLKERRSAFITAAVTGQIDLREEA